MCVSVIIMFGNLRTMNACVERSVLSQIHFCKTRMFGLWLPFKVQKQTKHTIVFFPKKKTSSYFFRDPNLRKIKPPTIFQVFRP